ncbi:MAG TPA: ATP-binding protein [Candidatus Limnocylindrales bacterium]|nr:ATP-binding protein [Candidatus Limnocylindrales bacterium]
MGARERRAAVTAAALVVGGLVMLRLGFGPFELRAGVLALLAGWIVGAAGLIAWLRVPAAPVGPLLVGAAVAWGIANLQRTSIGPIDVVAASLQLLYAAVLGAAVLTLPDQRPRRGSWIAIGVACVAGLLPQPVAGVTVAAALLLGMGAVTVHRLPNRSPSAPASAAGVAFAITLGVSTVARWYLPGFAAVDHRPAVEIAFIVAGISVAATSVRVAQRERRVTDLVVDLGPEGEGVVVRQLASALGDPTLEVAFALDGGNRFVDAAGRAVTLPASDSGRAVTVISHGALPVAALVHDPTTGADPGTRSAIRRAAELAGANAALQAQVQHQLEDVRASRRRLLDAADEERRSLRAQLDGDLGQRLDGLEAVLANRPADVDPWSVASAMAQLDEARLEMAAIAEGLHPRAVEVLGIAGAIRELARRSAVPVEVAVDPAAEGDLASEAALYFVCSEALANAAKHASATSISVWLARTGDSLVVGIEDDGVGGADPARGSGLAGLRDRIEALGGSLRVGDREGPGTRIVASVPALRRQPGRTRSGATGPGEERLSRS